MLKLLHLAFRPWAITSGAGKALWGVYLDALRDKAAGLKTYDRDVQARIEKGNPELHMFDAAEREARLSASAFGPGVGVKDVRYTRYYPDAQMAMVGLSGPLFRRADTMDTSDAQSTGSLMNTLRVLSTGQITTRTPKYDSHGFLDTIEEQENQPVRVVLFTLDGPGGEATQIDEAAMLIRGLADRGILTVMFIEGMAASAHFYLASAGQFIFGSRMSGAGSVGVVMGIPIPADKDEEGRNIIETPSGRQYVEFVNSTSPMKRADPTTKPGMEYYQNLVDKSAAIFIADVARYRNIPLNGAIEQLGQGRVLDIEDAVSRGLVDGIGTFDEVFAALTDNSLVIHGRSMTGASGAALNA